MLKPPSNRQLEQAVRDLQDEVRRLADDKDACVRECHEYAAALKEAARLVELLQWSGRVPVPFGGWEKGCEACNAVEPHHEAGCEVADFLDWARKLLVEYNTPAPSEKAP